MRRKQRKEMCNVKNAKQKIYHETMLDLNKINFRKLKLRKTFLKSLLFFKAGGLPFRTFFVLQLHAMVSISKRGRGNGGRRRTQRRLRRRREHQRGRDPVRARWAPE